MTGGPLGVADEDFWRDPFRDREGVIDRLAADDLRGLVLDAPSLARTDLHADVPVAGARRELISRARGQRFRDRAVLVVVRAESNEAFAARAFEWKEPADDVPPPPPPDDDDEGPLLDGVMTDFFYARLRERIPGIPWREGTLRVAMVVDDDRSNVAVVRVEGPPEADPAVRDFIARNRSPGYPRAVNPPAGPRGALPSYRLRPDTPALTFAPGIALELPARVELGEGARCEARGAFALPLLEREVVKPRDERADRYARLTGAQWVDVGDREAAAVVPVTLVVTADRPEEPAVLRLDVPVYGPVEAGATARGFFAADLLALPGMFREPGRYRVWALSGDVMVGPRALELAQ